jgi:hypothetical protein
MHTNQILDYYVLFLYTDDLQKISHEDFTLKPSKITFITIKLAR